MTKGLPASGKSTWAKELIDKEPGKWKRVNKDDLRAMLDNGKWSKQNEQFVLDIRDSLITTALACHFSVIVDDTNFAPKHEENLKQMAKDMGAEFEVKDFTDVPLITCIDRDLKRPASVGRKVIVQMYKQYIQPTIKAPTIDKNLPTAIICDLDGTLCLFDGNPYDRDFSKDKANKVVQDILDTLESDITLIIVSGRNGKFVEVTRQWLEDHNIPYDHLYMRKEDDMRKDVIIKQEIYENHIKGKYNIKFVLDDRNQVVDFWRSQGLTCLQVADGEF